MTDVVAGGVRVAETGRVRDFAGWVQPHLPALQRYAARLAQSAARDDLVQETLIRAGNGLRPGHGARDAPPRACGPARDPGRRP